MKKRLLSLALALMILLTACAPAQTSPVQTEPPAQQEIQTESRPGGADTATEPEQPESTEPPSSELPPETTEAYSEPTQPAQTEAPTQPPVTEAPTQPPATEAPTQPPATETPTQPPATEAPTQPPETEPPLSGSAAIIDAAYKLSPGEYLQGVHTLSGTVTAIETPYSSRYGNISVIISVPGSESKPILCFRLEGSGVENLAVGDSVTVSGRLMNYSGTIEFDAGCTLLSYVSTNPTPSQPVSHDDSRDAVAYYIHKYGRLPDFYMTKSQARQRYGWSGGALDNYAPGYAIGGDTFYNSEGILPNAPGRYWTECDIGTIGAGERGAKRIVFSNDGLIYYTSDHYATFTLLYGEP